MGKSAFANALIVKALAQGKRVMLVNNEMDENSCISRLISNIGGVSCAALQEPEKMTEQQISSVMNASDVLRSYKLNLYCMRFKTPQEILTEAARLNEIGQPIDWLVIDYLQLLQASDKERRKSRYDEVSYISWELKMAANDLKIPVLALSQLNRQLEQRSNKRPIPADLRESGSLEQDATAVMFIYRDEVYNPDSDDVGIAEINVSINSNGKSGVSLLAMDFDRMDIHNIDRYSENK
jgi:replicative DNA helicase